MSTEQLDDRSIGDRSMTSNGNETFIEASHYQDNTPRRGMIVGGGSGGMPPSFGGSPDSENFDPGSLLHSLRRHWPVALLLGILLAPAMAYLAWTMLVPKNSAIAYLRVDSIDAPLIFQTADRQNGRDTFELYKNTQSQLIRTPFVLNKALSETEVQELPSMKEIPDPFTWLSEKLRVSFPGDGEVMAISVEAADAKSAKKIVDSVVKAYMNEAVLDERNERLQRVDNLERVFAEAEGKVRARRADIRKLADTLGTGDSESLSLAQQLAVERYGQVQSELGQVNFQLMKAEGELQAYRQLSDKLGDMERKITPVTIQTYDVDAEEIESISLTDYEADQVLNRDNIYQTLIREGRQLREEIALFETKFGSGMIEFQTGKLDRIAKEALERKAEILRLATEEKQRRIVEGVDGTSIDPNLSPEERQNAIEREKIAEDREEKDQLVVAREIQVGVLEQQRQRIQQDLEQLDVEAKKLGRSSIDIEMMRAEISSLDEVLNRLSGEIERTKIELKSDSRITVISEATPLPNSDIRKRYAGTGLLALMGLFLPAMGLIGLDFVTKPVNNSGSISRGLSVPVLGTVPRKRNVSRILNDETFDDGAFGNSVSSIVAMLVNLSRFEKNKIIMVTSAVAGEGKTTLSTSLWRGLCEANFRVVLVDFDLRRPSVHRQFGVEIGRGTSDVVSGNANFEEVVHHIAGQGDYVTAGSTRPLNLSAVSHQGLPEFFKELRQQYDFVIIDTPPILPVVDTRVIGENVDSVVLAAMKDKSRVPQLIAANEMLRAHGTPVMGVVVNACNEKNGGYSYRY